MSSAGGQDEQKLHKIVSQAAAYDSVYADIGPRSRADFASSTLHLQRTLHRISDIMVGPAKTLNVASQVEIKYTCRGTWIDITHLCSTVEPEFSTPGFLTDISLVIDGKGRFLSSKSSQPLPHQAALSGLDCLGPGPSTDDRSV